VAGHQRRPSGLSQFCMNNIYSFSRIVIGLSIYNEQLILDMDVSQKSNCNVLFWFEIEKMDLAILSA